MSDADEFSVAVRAARPGDTAYLTATWLRGFWSGSGCRLDRAEYTRLHTGIVKGLLARAASWVAHPAGDEETILGFVVTEPGVVHWLYVRSAWRGNGIARTLVDAAGLDPSPIAPGYPEMRLRFTHWTSDAAALSRKYRGLVYYPYTVGVNT